jgi:hypothetical protein
MLKPSLVVGALFTSAFAIGHLQPAAAVTADDAALAKPAATGVLLAQAGGGSGDGGGSGGGGDSAGRGPDTSKGAVPTNPKDYPSGITSPGTAPVPPAPGTPGSPGTAPGGTAPGTTGMPGTAPGTGLGSPGTTQKGGTTRTDQ